MAAPVVRQFAAFGAGASAATAPTNVYFLTGSQSNLWINNNRPNLYRETDSTQFKDARWFNGGGNFTDGEGGGTGYIVGANTGWSPTTDGGGSNSYVYVWGFNIDSAQNVTFDNFRAMASYVTGTSYANSTAATAGLQLAGYYYGFDITPGGNDFQETNLTGAVPG